MLVLDMQMDIDLVGHQHWPVDIIGGAGIENVGCVNGSACVGTGAAVNVGCVDGTAWCGGTGAAVVAGAAGKGTDECGILGTLGAGAGGGMLIKCEAVTCGCAG